ncbi:glycosyltransferase family 4 protein [Priestia koreensis]|uniref:Glycosyl transferase family 1 n=1 Tax=Priestia koreensis TaxID=284581 RepID=A0A0M0LH94_9BACI|nr:glycosyltransferase family 4 protein [Priestia koreensis]KOO50424.1 glycosyl transferase family 1 [Priestia koreensis]
MNKKKICFIAQFPPPIHGLSKAVDTLYNSDLSNEFEFTKVDITNNKQFLKNLMKIWVSNADLFYFTISQTKGGNIRDLIILNILKLRKKKCLIHLHGGYYRQLVENDLSNWQRNINYRAMKNLAGAIVLGPSLKPIFQGMVDESKIFIVPNCVDDEFLISDVEFTQKLDSLKDKKVLNVLYLSNFIQSKGYPKVLEMAKLERDRVVNDGEDQKFHFDFAGKFFNDDDREFFERYVRQNKLQDFITYHGIVSGKKKRDLLKKSNIFVLLTTYPNEGQPISILEAMGNGMVIVTTNHAGIPDVVQNGENGLILPVSTLNNIDVLDGIEKFTLKDIKTIIEKNYNNTREEYTEERYLSNMSEIFDTIN